jgi:hypothetical protein
MVEGTMQGNMDQRDSSRMSHQISYVKIPYASSNVKDAIGFPGRWS